jgi:hypothetical protein
MEVAFGALYVRPEDFWGMTWPEYRAATQGWKRLGPPSWLGASEETVDDKEVEETLEFVRETEERFPPGKETDNRVVDFLKEQRRLRKK